MRKLGTVLAIIIAIAIMVGISAIVEQSHKNSVQADLESRYGTVELSDEQISKIADSVSTDYANKAAELNKQWDAIFGN